MVAMTKLSVNVNKVATLRNTRPKLNIPSVVRCAAICLDAGADGITIHPRPDQRHIKRDDVAEIAALVKTDSALWIRAANELDPRLQKISLKG